MCAFGRFEGKWMGQRMHISRKLVTAYVVISVAIFAYMPLTCSYRQTLLMISTTYGATHQRNTNVMVQSGGLFLRRRGVEVRGKEVKYDTRGTSRRPQIPQYSKYKRGD